MFMEKRPTEVALNQATIELWEMVKPELAGRLYFGGGVTQLPEGKIEEAREISKLLGIDVDAIFEDVSTRKGFTVPKSWANLNEDGTPKKKGKSKKKGKKKNAKVS